MNNDILAVIVVLSPLLAVFLLFLGVIYFRSKHNKTHPEPSAATRFQKQLSFLTWGIALLAGAVWTYLNLEKSHFAPSWATTLWGMCGTFILGDALGAWRTRRYLLASETRPSEATQSSQHNRP